MLISIEKVNYQDCIRLRQKVLWPTYSLRHCCVKGDALAEHFALKKNGAIISCISVFDLGDDTYQIRKFATDQNHQFMGYGSQLFQHTLNIIHTKNPKKIIVSSRVSASSFYMRFGFHQSGDRSIKDGIDFIKMECNFPENH